jgi:putative CocE/NonD family hydrolase
MSDLYAAGFFALQRFTPQMTGSRFARAREAGVVCALVAASAVWLSAGSGVAAAATVQKQGYIPMADGTQLEYTVALPAGAGRFPVAMAYAGYCEGQNALGCNDAVNAPALLAAGYAVLGVSIRGTSCSTGTFDPFTSQEWRDGAAAIEWAARQPWSNGRLGLFGLSFPGVTQLGVAGLRPPHLDAIAPFQAAGDLYRDVAAPGGIPNTGFGAFWGLGDQPAASYSSGAEQSVEAQDGGCAQAQLTHLAAEPSNNIFAQGMQHLWDDGYWRAREPGADAAEIDVPALGCVTWQDDEISSRGSFDLATELNPARTWLVAGNGYHGACETTAPPITAELVAFFDRFVKGDRNGFDHTPHLQVWHDTAKNSAGDNVPAWITSFGSASVPVRPLALYFGPNGALSLTRPKGEAPPARYAYPGPAPGTEDGTIFGQHHLLWKGEEPPAASVAYTTPPLNRDAEFFGSGSTDLWLSSTALHAGSPAGVAGVGADTDLQITLTEVRPDGQEAYIARGWLRASHRALDRKRSTALAPFHTDQQKDAAPLVPGRPTSMRVQLWPFDYVFRKGSSIRLWIDAPTGETGGWSFDYVKTPEINSVYADAAHPSALVLGYLPGARARAPLPACDTLINQPCRRNLVPVSPGTMTIR